MAKSNTVSDQASQANADEQIATYLEIALKNFYRGVSFSYSAKEILALPVQQQTVIFWTLVKKIFEQYEKSGMKKDLLADSANIRQALKNPSEDRQSYLAIAVSDNHLKTSAAKQLISCLCKKPIPLSEEQVQTIVKYKIAEFFFGITTGDDERFADAAVCAERYSKNKELSIETKELLKIFAQLVSHVRTGSAGSISKTSRSVLQRIQALTQSEIEAAIMQIPITPEDAWADKAIADLNGMDAPNKTYWISLLEVCTRANSTKPSSKWSKEAESIIKEIGEETFTGFAESWFSLFPAKSSVKHDQSWLDEVMKPENQDLLRGLAWCCAQRKDPKLALALGNAAESCFKKVPNFGPRSKVVGNACLYALSEMNTKEAISQLSRVQTRAKHASSQQQIEKALHRAANHAGMTVEDLQDVGVPDFGLSQDHVRIEQFGDYRAELRVSDDGEVDLNWFNSAGKGQKSAPAAVKKDYAAQFKALKKVKDDLEKILSTTIHRVEHSLVNQRHWAFSAWKERYLDHPVCSIIARRLLWNFNGKAGIWQKGKIVDLQGTELQPDESTIVELWHPISVEPGTVLSWRRWLIDHNVTQPFKQCYREIYVLTDAEKETNTYSNRFAGHIIRQHQFQQLCTQRGWKYMLQGSFDSHNTPTLKLPKWNLSAQFWVEIPEGASEEILADSFIAMIVATDQVRFVRESNDDVPLTEILPIVFSEVMRDVDLFVSVCSIGTDPNYTGGYGDYWNHFSFGELTTSGSMRKQALSDLLPMLKIADRCEIKEKFLVVRGDLRTYKIHLGSGSIMMEPNDQYLCIVSDKRATALLNIRLPFAGDAVLSMIISKAIMLAEDKKITDKSILSQINMLKG